MVSYALSEQFIGALVAAESKDGGPKCKGVECLALHLRSKKGLLQGRIHTFVRENPGDLPTPLLPTQIMDPSDISYNDSWMTPGQ